MFLAPNLLDPIPGLVNWLIGLNSMIESSVAFVISHEEKHPNLSCRLCLLSYCVPPPHLPVDPPPTLPVDMVAEVSQLRAAVPGEGRSPTLQKATQTVLALGSPENRNPSNVMHSDRGSRHRPSEKPGAIRPHHVREERGMG